MGFLFMKNIIPKQKWFSDLGKHKMLKRYLISENRVCNLTGYLSKYLFLTLCLVCFGNFSVNALGVNEIDSEEYLLNHGHSAEIVRMVQLQEKRTENSQRELNKSNKFVKFWKNIFYEKDVTLPLSDFGYNNILTPEAP